VTTTADLAVRLREIADALTAADLNLHVYLSISEADMCGDETTRVAAIDTAARLLGLTAEPVKNGGSWYHLAREERGDLVLRVGTHIKEPARRCACGAVCAHATSDGAR